MEREKFQAYIEEKKRGIDEDYSRGVIDDATRNRLYLLCEETETRYQEIRIADLNQQIQFARLAKANYHDRKSLDDLHLQATTVAFDLECTLRELRESTGR